MKIIKPQTTEIVARVFALFSSNQPLSAMGDDTTGSTTVNAVNGVTSFADNSTVINNIIDNTDEPTAHLEGFEKTAIDEFLSRPVKIFATDWVHGTQLTETILPWDLLLANPLVADKIRNFQLFSADLHVRIMINGTPFHAGRFFAGYMPLPDLNRRSVHGGGHRESIVMQTSQCPGSESPMSPTTNDVQEFRFPFFNPQMYLNVPELLAPPYSDLNTMGQLSLVSTGVLRTANGEIVNANITVYAWFSSVQLLVPTPSPLPLAGDAAESDETIVQDTEVSVPDESAATPPTLEKIISLKDQFIEAKKDGMISTLSSAVASAAGMLSAVPIIGPYATAASGVLNGVSKVARFFGFAKPNIMTDPTFVKNLPVQSLSHVSGNETSMTLSFDPKASTTHDPTTVGLSDVDQMTFSFVSQKWSTFALGILQTTDAIGTAIMDVGVTPSLMRNDTQLPDHITMTPSAFVSLPFKYWSGTMHYKLIIAASQYHSGRLLITYDPAGTDHVSDASNQQLNIVLDISQQTEIEFSISWAQAQSYKTTIQEDRQAWGSLFAYNDDDFNGSFRIQVLNPLVAPVPGADVDFILMARAGSDFELQVPSRSTLIQENTPLSSDIIENDMDANNCFVGEPSTMFHKKAVQFTGERVLSIRQLIKRTTPFQGFLIDEHSGAWSGSAWAKVEFPLGGFPSANGVTSTFEGNQCNQGFGTQVVNTPYMSYFNVAYAGWRGGINWKITSDMQYFCSSSMAIKRDVILGTNSIIVTPIVSTPLAFANAFAVDNNGHEGMAMTVIDNQPVLEVSVPYYNKLRFCSTDPAKDRALNRSDGSENMRSTLQFYARKNSSTVGILTGETYVSAADDMTFFWFIRAPILRLDGN